MTVAKQASQWHIRASSTTKYFGAQKPCVEGRASSAKRLLDNTWLFTDQSKIVRRFLLRIVFPQNFSFHFNDLKKLEFDLYADCLAIAPEEFSKELGIENRVGFDVEGYELVKKELERYCSELL